MNQFNLSFNVAEASQSDASTVLANPVVRISTSVFATHRGLAYRRDISIMKRLTNADGDDLLSYDIGCLGADEVLSRIGNFTDVSDGLYVLRTVNISHDWETNTIDDYDYKLEPYIEPDVNK